MNRQPPSATFSPPSRAGALLWMRPHQVTVAALCLAWVVLPLTVGAPLFSMRNLPAALLFAASMVNVGERSLWQWLATRLGFQARRATGQTRWTVSPMAAGSTVGLIDLPGAAGKRLKPMRVESSRFAGAAWIADSDENSATALLCAQAFDWQLTAGSERASRASGYAAMAAAACREPGVVRLTVQARRLMVPNPDPMPEGGSGDAWTDLEETARELDTIPGYDVTLALTLDLNRLGADIRREGGGSKGVGEILAARMRRLASSMPAAGVDPDSVWWPDTGMLRGMVKTIADPSAHRVLDQAGRLPDDMPVTGTVEEWDECVRVDRVWASTMWVDRWPKDPTPAGWLEGLLNGGGRQVVITQTWKALSRGQAVRDIDNRSAEIERTATLSRTMGRQPDPALARERDDLEARRTAVDRDDMALAFQTLVTLIAPDRSTLDKWREGLMASLPDGMHLDPLAGQQWAGWLAALPLGQSGR